MNDIVLLILILLILVTIAWFVLKKIVYGLFYAATKAIENAKRKDNE